MTGRRSFFRWSGSFLGGIILALGGCALNGSQGNEQSAKTLSLSSTAFGAEAAIPAKYTCDGENLSPALSWDKPPEGTRSLVVIADDPDAPGKPFTHWVLYDIPPDMQQLPEGLPAKPFLPNGGVQGKSDFGQYGYGGPCPPEGSHRYVFKLYALDTPLDLPPGVTQVEVRQAMAGHILASGELIGRYQRQR